MEFGKQHGRPFRLRLERTLEATLKARAEAKKQRGAPRTVTPYPMQDSETTEELYEWAYDNVQNKWVKITAANSQGRKCGPCGCACPCRCSDCLFQCCA